jgi:hypothetical protein
MDDYYASVPLIGQPLADKPEEKSRPVVKGTCGKATTASYSLSFLEAGLSLPIAEEKQSKTD